MPPVIEICQCIDILILIFCYYRKLKKIDHYNLRNTLVLSVENFYLIARNLLFFIKIMISISSKIFDLFSTFKSDYFIHTFNQ